MFTFTNASFRPTEDVTNIGRRENLDEMDWEEGLSGGQLGVVVPGETITSSMDFMRGHGTFADGEDVAATVAGTLQRVNKLLSVKPIRSRYTPQIGDLVVARIVDVQPKRWKVDANGQQDAVLMLSSVNLPGGIQRRKLESDELQMRLFFEEGDLLVAEVQAFFADGAMSLHTRSLRYGKLRNGQLVTVPPILIRRLKSHFCALKCGVDAILGINGYIWVCKHVQESHQAGEEGFNAESVYSNKNDHIDTSTHLAIVRVSNILKIMSQYYIPITDSALNYAYSWVMENGLEAKNILRRNIAETLVEAITGDTIRNYK
ncbi:exosome non-catalytic core subunit rrp4 [Serendipita sp. 401]|nr:exosome non-catalytic core subunit rrp4 [Serendipita sp. 397]KAG8828807.1 exosome non-catalytic core subunit rrp4 [Serendipita sp. 401]KAG8876519.1 exosome non-catalytic core subunit rrp4 [Serendipita sp. 405]KAG9058671.1 exosome non-catalytic core subunit rrp4 [Serendipita sp. 407]